MDKTIEKVNDGSDMVSNGYNKIETWNKENIEELSEIYYRVLKLIGEDPDREGLKKTPERVAKALHFLTNGYTKNPCKIINSAKFKEDYKQMVIVKDIDIYSMCEHHMLPFFGKAHVAYPQWVYHRPQQDSPCCGDIQQEAAGTGAPYHRDKGLSSGLSRSLRRCCGN